MHYFNGPFSIAMLNYRRVIYDHLIVDGDFVWYHMRPGDTVFSEKPTGIAWVNQIFITRGQTSEFFPTWFGCADSCNISFRRHIIETKAKPDDPLLLCMSPTRELAVQVENEAHKFGALVDYAADTLWDMFTLSGLAYYVFFFCKIWFDSGRL